MAISATKMRPLLQADIEKLIHDIEHELSTTWAVRADYNQESMEWEIYKIEPWSGVKHTNSSFFTYKIKGATDELDAYNKFIEQVSK